MSLMHCQMPSNKRRGGGKEGWEGAGGGGGGGLGMMKGPKEGGLSLVAMHEVILPDVPEKLVTPLFTRTSQKEGEHKANEGWPSLCPPQALQRLGVPQGEANARVTGCQEIMLCFSYMHNRLAAFSDAPWCATASCLLHLGFDCAFVNQPCISHNSVLATLLQWPT